ncbi:SDR family NAD(P)-dependent oxidoreductase [Sulfitobacter sp. S190]|uniref:SDR family NAD(P)-dependent oxidoreductase n=1 Tax=Sulfitobacter sp. S190 TaxID=2867022 RepID=UPI0021A7C7CF|nr:SDR family oxidoreductase [Sulfitobacter sp. S190]UWR21317.1 SDR family oxidoreductase [Sulfitobacter sp. S190]
MKPVALVTGAARGIGRAIADNLAPDHQLAVTYNATPPTALQAAHPGIQAIHADLADPASATRIIDEIIARHGRLDIIVNNAGSLELDSGNVALNHAVNVAAPMALLNAALAHLKPGACVISISSVNAVLPALGASSYSASKAALNTWTRGMARELGAQGIRVNAVAPGAIERSETPRPPEMVKAFADLTALGRVGTPEDIAPVVRFLASDAARFITGEIITVSGGYRL